MKEIKMNKDPSNQNVDTKETSRFFCHCATSFSNAFQGVNASKAVFSWILVEETEKELWLNSENLRV